MKMAIETITPREAATILARNIECNRKLRPRKIAEYAGVMLRGKWELSHQGIAFDIDGKLVDGQHRLFAVVKANVPVKFPVTRGVSRGAYKVLDSGMSRAYADRLRDERKVVEIYTTSIRLLSRANSVTVDMVEDVQRNLSAMAQQLLEYAPTSARFFASAPTKTAAVFRMFSDPGNRAYILNLYRNLTLVNMADLPPIGLAINRQVFKGHAMATQKSDTLARMWVCFDKTKANNSKIQIKDPAPYCQEMREAYVSTFGLHEWMI